MTWLYWRKQLADDLGNCCGLILAWREQNSELIKGINSVRLIITKSHEFKNILGCGLVSEAWSIWDGSK